MAFPRIIIIGSLALFGLIGVVAFFKKGSSKTEQKVVEAAPVKKKEEPVVLKKQMPTQLPLPQPPRSRDLDMLTDIDRVHQLFTTGPTKLPIVETISYTSRVAWLKGRPAWVADYAVHYNTSRHFIARSLNGKPDYLSQKVSTGSRFNVFRKDKNIQFYLLVEASSCKMGFYYLDLDSNERVLLKTYRVGLGRMEAGKTATPLGSFALGKKVAVYQSGMMGYFGDKKVELIRVYGTRWIPFDEKGHGLHGVPWVEDKEDRDTLGKYESDGSIRLATDDIEELFAIVITKPTTLVVVEDFRDANLPGVEVAVPTR